MALTLPKIGLKKKRRRWKTKPVILDHAGIKQSSLPRGRKKLKSFPCGLTSLPQKRMYCCSTEEKAAAVSQQQIECFAAAELAGLRSNSITIPAGLLLLLGHFKQNCACVCVCVFGSNALLFSLQDHHGDSVKARPPHLNYYDVLLKYPPDYFKEDV